MTSELALRALGAVALPGAFLAVVAPAASAVEVSPGSYANVSGNDATEATAPLTGQATDLPDTSGLLGGQSVSL